MDLTDKNRAVPPFKNEDPTLAIYARPLVADDEILLNNDTFITSVMVGDSLFQFHFKGLVKQDDKPLIRLKGTAIKRWQAVLDFSGTKDVEVLVISAYFKGIIMGEPKSSITFFGQLINTLFAILYNRYCLLNGRCDSGLLVILADTASIFAKEIESHLIEIAHVKHMDVRFLDWIENSNLFVTIENVGSHVHLLHEIQY